MKLIKNSISETEFHNVLSNLTSTVSNKKEKIVCLGDFLYIRFYFSSKKAVFFFRHPKIANMQRIGAFPEYSYNRAKEIVRNFVCELNNDVIDKDMTPLFGTLADEWLSTKTKLVRFPNIKKSVEYLQPLNKMKINEITNRDVKKALLFDQKITPYKIHETLETFVRIMNYAVEDEYIPSHNFNLLIKSDSFPKHIKGEGYKYVEYNDLGKILNCMSNLPEKFRCFFLMQLLTCLRPGECRKLKFEYFDLNKRIIYVPGEIMKVKRKQPFRIPITEYILSLYKYIEHKHFGEEYLFSCERKQAPIQERDISVAIKVATNSRVHAHGFRKTARSYFADHNVSLEVAAMCFDHQLNTGADRFYQKSDLLNLRTNVLANWNQAVYAVCPKSYKDLFII